MARHAAPTVGLTLIEVLVVIGIIVVLAAVVVPVFSALQSRHYVSTCANNLKTIGQALLMYRDDYMAFPPDATEWWDQDNSQHGLGLAHLFYGYWAHETGMVRPDGDAAAGWNATNSPSPHCEQIDEVVVQPHAGDTGDSVWATDAENTAVETFDMATIPGVGPVSQVDLWVFCKADGGGSARVAINMPDGVNPHWQAAQTLSPGSEYAWERLTWDGNWSQINLNGLQVRFVAVTPQSGQVIRVAALYVEATWSRLPMVVAAGNYLTTERVLRCPLAPARTADFNDWPYLGGYNVYDWNYCRDRSDAGTGVWPDQGLRNLKQPFPPDNTVVTWCPRHRLSPPGAASELGRIVSRDFDPVLWVDGSVSRMPSRFDQYQAEQPR